MLRHVAMFRFTPESTRAQQEAAFETLRSLPGVIPQIRDYKVGTDAGLVEGNWQAVVVADFDDEEGWRTYSQDPTHLQIIAEQIRPIVAERAGVQYVI
jgi:Stress responsive A/B Barrel Domain